jgi:drug/metabolite transporter (DMT)-like permease
LTGIVLALGALLFWSLTPFFFAATGRMIGPFATNLLRLSVAAPVMLAASIVGLLLTGITAAGLPDLRAILILALSGVLGLGLGDLLLYRSLFRVGPERSSLLMTLAPAAAAAMAYSMLDESLSGSQLGGMTLVLGGVLLAVWKSSSSTASGTSPRHHGFWYGASAGIAAAVCQAASSVMVRQVFLESPDLSPLHATTVRITAAALAILVVARTRNGLTTGFKSMRLPRVLPRLLAGTLSGPILGMTCYIAAMKYQPAGVVVTITFMTPLLVMPLGAWHYGTRIGTRMVAGAGVALAGIALLGWNPG